MFPNIFKNIPSPKIYQLVDIDVLIQSHFRVIQRIVFVYLCKPYHKVIIVSCFNLYLENIKSFPGDIKSLFYDFIRASCRCNRKKAYIMKSRDCLKLVKSICMLILLLRWFLPFLPSYHTQKQELDYVMLIYYLTML